MPKGKKRLTQWENAVRLELLLDRRTLGLLPLREAFLPLWHYISPTAASAPSPPT